ncbi:MAG: phosphoribosylformylglycinamidine synthase subunit PurS [Nitrospiraceae bacterium]|nr:phosphoribosylformylglycinamidine synthase subunit PurS [Nitrospiraceae bacterium]
MKARVFVRLKDSVLDPQGKAVLSGLQGLGAKGLADVRVGKLIEITFAPGMKAEEAGPAIRQMCEKLLANPVIEEWSYELTD